MKKLITVIINIFAFKFTMAQNTTPVRYLPLGDSYTICTGATNEESWPKLLTTHLNNADISTTLLTNPARNGFSTQDLINKELPLVEKLQPNFITLLIGVNDWVQGVPIATFEQNLITILNTLQQRLPSNSTIIIITIPDFGVTPQGSKYGSGRDISEGIKAFNNVIIQAAKKQNLTTVDVFELSKKMKNDSDLVAIDGLHPSAKEYAQWENKILPIAIKLLR